MTEIEQKALALLNEVQADWNYQLGSLMFKRDRDVFSEALCRAIEQHEAFRQEVSDAVVHCRACSDPEVWRRIKFELNRFIISKPDPLVDVLLEMDLSSDPEEGQHDAKWLRIKLDALGFEIREKNDDQ